MNDEIKEILEFKEDADYKRLCVDEIVVLRDYITNLQEEIKGYKQEREKLFGTIHELQKSYEKLERMINNDKK